MDRLADRWKVLLSLAIMTGLLLPRPAFAANVALDGAGGTGGRTTHAIGPKTAAVRYASRLRVFEYDATSGDLRWGTRTATGWSFARLDGAGGTAGRISADVGEDQAAVVYEGELHVFYYDRTHGDLRWGRFDGSSWSFSTLDGAGGAGRVNANVGLRVSAAVYANVLRVAYANTSAGDVRLATFTGGAWSMQTLDGRGGAAGRIDGNVGWNTAMSVYGSALHVFYLWQDPFCDEDVCNFLGTIREATFAGTTWAFRNVDQINCCITDQSLAVAPLSGTNVYLVYQNAGVTTVNIRAKHWNGSSWSNVGCIGEPFEQDDSVGYFGSAAVVGGIVRVTYFDWYSNTFNDEGVVHTSFDGTTWRTALVGIRSGSPASSIASGGLKVFVGDAQIGDDPSAGDDLVLATPGTGGMVVPPDNSCG
jgi:hypothetical protein